MQPHTHPHVQEAQSCSPTELWGPAQVLPVPMEHLQMQWLREGSNMVPGLQVQRKLPRVFRHSASLHKPCIKHSLISAGRGSPGSAGSPWPCGGRAARWRGAASALLLPAKPASRALMVPQGWRDEGRAQGLVPHVGAGSALAAERAHC